MATFEKKFAATRTVKNDEEILKYFRTKEEAISYAESAAETNTEGVIAVIEAEFNFEGVMNNNTCRVYRVFES